MSDPKIYEELISCTDGRICGIVTYCRRPCIYMVDRACAGEVPPHHWKAEVKLLGLNAQVWRQDPQVSEREKGILRGECQYPFVGHLMQIN